MRARFTVETARQAGLASAAKRAQRKADEAERKRLAQEQALASAGNDNPTFPQELKARVRVQTLETLSRLEEENARGQNVDGAKLDRLASALERLAELERILDGRPGPGNRRPPREDLPSAKASPAPRPAFTHAGPAPGATPAAASPTSPPTPEPPSLTERPDF